ncbi:tetratricopeptide repeat protein [Pseudoalteromonas sp. OOF1S-7]|uniref:tetratricopeptide repeat protein n=1 Tax=Pseudoalteromonas sp. OOF1S-7 TaxID=2917757 RepID=UPI001EF598E5|nr:tetratricopeptide repeat protein [Pseudoalteromonas sp. OOF1S-7]MCG7533711.1 tetratricopeptide repeat protein [Pseudoalteromonas sp. OOF1S-7]
MLPYARFARRYLCPLLAISTLLLSGCESTKVEPEVNMLLLDNVPFSQHAVETQNEIFALDANIRATLDRYLDRNNGSNIKVAEQLLQFLVENGDSSLSYMRGANLSAAEAFYDLNANCLSLSILAYSLSDYLGFKGQFQRVHIPEYWAQTKGYSLLTGHVNLVVTQTNSGARKNSDNREVLYTRPARVVIDFDPNSRQQKFTTSKISKERITAMFYSNKGAMHMINKEMDMAYSYFRAAIDIDPLYSAAWGNLAVLYRINNHTEQAESLYQQALLINDENKTALGNLALLYELTDRPEKAKAIRTQLHTLRKDNPYYQIALGDEAFANENYDKALKHYRTANKLSASIHEGYFGLAKVYYVQGDLELSKTFLNRALNHASFTHDKKRYRNKLEWLSAVAKN